MLNRVNIIIGDSMGEMQSWFATADVVFIGGSLVETGGHNPLEATAQGAPVVSGQYMFNFTDIIKELEQSDLLYICQTETEIESKILALLELSSEPEFTEFQIKAKNDHATTTSHWSFNKNNFIFFVG